MCLSLFMCISLVNLLFLCHMVPSLGFEFELVTVTADVGVGDVGLLMGG